MTDSTDLPAHHLVTPTSPLDGEQQDLTVDTDPQAHLTPSLSPPLPGGRAQAPASAPHGLRSIEHPLTESVRSLLRLEHLLQRWQLLVTRADVVDHHHALLTAFEIMELGTRRDLRQDVDDELRHQQRHLESFRGNPSIAEAVLDAAIERIADTLGVLDRSPRRVETVLAANDFLIAIRSRAAVAGGLCAFDLPAYAHWQQASPEQRRADLHRWISEPLVPLAEALEIALGLLREGGHRQSLVALNGRHQQSLTGTRAGLRAPQLARVRFDMADGVVPEISANRLQIAVQFTRPEPDGSLVPDPGDAPFELTLFH